MWLMCNAAMGDRNARVLKSYGLRRDCRSLDSRFVLNNFFFFMGTVQESLAVAHQIGCCRLVLVVDGNPHFAQDDLTI